MFDLCLGAYINPRNRAVVPSSSCRSFAQLSSFVFVLSAVALSVLDFRAVEECRSFFRLLRYLCCASVELDLID